MYDFGKEENIKKYGQPVPPVMDVAKAAKVGVPITMYAMKHDMMLEIKDQRKTRDLLGDSAEYFELNGGHSTFSVGKEMSWVKTNVLKSMNKYNPLN